MASDSVKNNVEEIGQAEESSNLDDVVKESQEALAAEEQQPVRQKRKYTKRKNKEEKPQEPEKKEPDHVLAPILGMVAAVPFDIAAQKTRFDGYKLNDDEKAAIGHTLNDVVDKYLPDMNEKVGPALIAGFTIVTIVMTKYSAHQSWLNEQRKQIETHNNASQNENTASAFLT